MLPKQSFTTTSIIIKEKILRESLRWTLSYMVLICFYPFPPPSKLWSVFCFVSGKGEGEGWGVVKRKTSNCSIFKRIQSDQRFKRCMTISFPPMFFFILFTAQNSGASKKSCIETWASHRIGSLSATLHYVQHCIATLLHSDWLSLRQGCKKRCSNLHPLHYMSHCITCQITLHVTLHYM